MSSSLPGTQALIAAIRAPLTFMLIATSLAALLVPVIVLLFALSNRQFRSLFVFKLNIFICLIGLLEGALIDALQWKAIFSVDGGVSASFAVASFTVILCTPLLVDSVLLLRIIAFYPRPQIDWTKRLRILAVPLATKLTRCAMLALWLHGFYTNDIGGRASIATVLTTTWYRNAYLTAEWSLQILDNSYSSLFFLYKLGIFNKEGRHRALRAHSSVLHRIRDLFYIALGNFVFPVLLNIVQIALITFDKSFLVGTYIVCVNGYVSIFGVVFATIWTSSKRYHELHAGGGRPQDTIASFGQWDDEELGQGWPRRVDYAGSMHANVCNDACLCHRLPSSASSSEATVGGPKEDDVGTTMSKLGYCSGLANSMRDSKSNIGHTSH